MPAPAAATPPSTRARSAPRTSSPTRCCPSCPPARRSPRPSTWPSWTYRRNPSDNPALTGGPSRSQVGGPGVWVEGVQHAGVVVHRPHQQNVTWPAAGSARRLWPLLDAGRQQIDHLVVACGAHLVPSGGAVDTAQVG